MDGFRMTPPAEGVSASIMRSRYWEIASALARGRRREGWGDGLWMAQGGAGERNWRMGVISPAPPLPQYPHTYPS